MFIQIQTPTRRIGYIGTIRKSTPTPTPTLIRLLEDELVGATHTGCVLHLANKLRRARLALRSVAADDGCIALSDDDLEIIG